VMVAPSVADVPPSSKSESVFGNEDDMRSRLAEVESDADRRKREADRQKLDSDRRSEAIRAEARRRADQADRDRSADKEKKAEAAEAAEASATGDSAVRKARKKPKKKKPKMDVIAEGDDDLAFLVREMRNVRIEKLSEPESFSPDPPDLVDSSEQDPYVFPVSGPKIRKAGVSTMSLIALSAHPDEETGIERPKMDLASLESGPVFDRDVVALEVVYEISNVLSFFPGSISRKRKDETIGAIKLSVISNPVYETASLPGPVTSVKHEYGVRIMMFIEAIEMSKTTRFKEGGQMFMYSPLLSENTSIRPLLDGYLRGGGDGGSGGPKRGLEKIYSVLTEEIDGFENLDPVFAAVDQVALGRAMERLYNEVVDTVDTEDVDNTVREFLALFWASRNFRVKTVSFESPDGEEEFEYIWDRATTPMKPLNRASVCMIALLFYATRQEGIVSDETIHLVGVSASIENPPESANAVAIPHDGRVSLVALGDSIAGTKMSITVDHVLTDPDRMGPEGEEWLKAASAIELKIVGFLSDIDNLSGRMLLPQVPRDINLITSLLEAELENLYEAVEKANIVIMSARRFGKPGLAFHLYWYLADTIFWFFHESTVKTTKAFYMIHGLRVSAIGNFGETEEGTE
jgi:hypothetical protein